MYDIIKIDQMIDAAVAQKREMVTKFVNDCCPYRPGDQVKITGYSYTGRMLYVENVDGVVRKAGRPGDGEEQKYVAEWTISGRVVKADGTVGSIRTKFTERIDL